MVWYPLKPGLQFVQTDIEGQTERLALIAHVTTTPLAPGAATAVAATALTAGAQAGLTAGITQPDVSRNVTISGNAAGITGNVTVHGTNANGSVISETIALNGATQVPGAKIFASVTAYDLPIQTHGGTDTVSLGYGGKLQLPTLLSANTVLLASYGGTKEATAPTVTTSTTAIESNTILLNTTLAGSEVDYWYIAG